MKILLNDGLDKEGVDMFLKEDIEVDARRRELDELISDVHDFDAIIVRSKTRIEDPRIFEAGKGRLKMIGRAGVEYDNIDVKAAYTHGIVVKNAPNGTTISVAEWVIGTALDLSRTLSVANSSMHEGRWEKSKLGKRGRELFGKTLGIIGCGRIGQRVAKEAAAFGMKLIGYDQNLGYVRENFPESEIEMYHNPLNVLSEADIVTLHTGGSEEVLTREGIAVMKSDAFVINGSRDKNLNKEALYEALTSNPRRIAGAAIDVHPKEPKGKEEVYNSQFRGLENVILTPHLAGSTEEGQRRCSMEMARVTIDYLRTGDLTNAVGLIIPKKGQEKVYPVFLYHRDIPGVFRDVSSVFGKYKINISEQKTGKVNGHAVTTFLVESPVTETIISELRAIKEVERVTY